MGGNKTTPFIALAGFLFGIFFVSRELTITGNSIASQNPSIFPALITVVGIILVLCSITLIANWAIKKRE